MKNHALALLVVAGAAAAANADVFNGAGFTPPDALAGGASSSVNVTGLGNVSSLALTLNWGTITSTAASNAPNRNHSWIGDLHITLTGPAGTFTIQTRVGQTAVNVGAGDSSDMRGSYTYSDSAAGDIWAAAALAGAAAPVPAGSYRTTGAFSGAPTSLMGFFGGSASNGTWTLFISDNAGGDMGDLVSWSLDIVPTPGAAAMLGLGGLAALRRRRA